MTEKRFQFRRFDVDVEDINEIALYEIDNNPSNDLDESNLFYVYSTTHANVQDIVDKLNNQEERIKELEKESEQLKEAINILKHRHSLLHDVCIEAEFDRDWYHKDVISLEKENEKLKEEIKRLKSINGIKYGLW